MIITAIDPGLNGGIATLDADGVSAIAMPVIAASVIKRQRKQSKLKTEGRGKRELDLDAIVHQVKGADLMVIELVGSMPGQGVTSMFNFGKAYGCFFGIAAALDIPIHTVYSQTWKRDVLAGTEMDKDAAIAFCRKHYPDVELIPPRCRNPHDGIADAVCILEWAKRKFLTVENVA